MYNNVVGKPIKGVVYDDIDKEVMREEMFGLMDDLYEFEDKLPDYPSTKAMLEVGIELDDIKQYYHNMDAIAALTRYNFNTGITHNLIIPKESLSIGLVSELEKVDLGKDLLKKYAGKFFEKDCDSENIYYECQEQLPTNNEVIKIPDNCKFVIDGKRVSVEDFVKFAESHPELIESLSKMSKIGKAL